MKVFWTSIFWILLVFLAALYLKTFDDTLGTKVASWIAPHAVVSSLSGAELQDPVLLEISAVQEHLETMMSQIDMIASKLGITSLVTTGDIVPVGTWTIVPAQAK